MGSMMEEQPFEPLNLDPARWDPNGAGRRFVLINDALMVRYKLVGELRRSGAGTAERKSDDYKNRRGQQYEVEAEIDALQRKYDTLKTLFFVKTAELKHLLG